MAFDYRDNISFEEYQALYGTPARDSSISKLIGWSLAIACLGWIVTAGSVSVAFDKVFGKR